MPPLDKNKRTAIAILASVIPLLMVGSFLWSFFKDLPKASQNGNHHANVSFLIFGGFFGLLIIPMALSSAYTLIRNPWRQDKSPPTFKSIFVSDNNPFATAFLILFSLPFAGFGLFALVQAVRKLIAGNGHDAAMLIVFGLMFGAVGFGLIFGVFWNGKKAKQSAAIQAAHPNSPWLVRPDWASGCIKSAVPSQAWIMLVIALAFCLMGGFFSLFVLPGELHQGNQAAMIVLLFPAVGIGLLTAFIKTFRSYRRFGPCYFKPAAVPIPLGGFLQGMIQTSQRIRLEQGLHLQVFCIRRVVSGAGKNRSDREEVLWQGEKVLSPLATLPEPEPGRITINGTAVTAVNRWLIVSRTRRFDPSAITQVEPKAGMTSGNHVFSNLQLSLRTGKKTTIASNIPNSAEARWLAQEMNRSLGRNLTEKY